MVSISDVIDLAFAEQGPVQRMKGEYRPLQRAFALRFAHYIETGSVPWIQEARAGVGKTLPILIGLMLDKMLNNRHGIISALTRALRESYLTETEMAARIVQEALHEMRQDNLFQLVSVEELKSTTSYLSPSKIRVLRQRWGDASKSERELVNYFLDTVQQGELAEFSEYYGGGGVLPPNTSELDWCLCAEDRHHDVTKAILANRESTRDHAAILLVTHALFIRNNLSGGKLFQSGTDWNLRNGFAVIDEADKLPPVAADAVTYTVSRNNIAALAHLRHVSAPARPKYQAAKDLIQSGLDQLSSDIQFDEAGFLIRSQTILAAKTPVLDGLLAIHDGLQDLQSIATGQITFDDADIIQADRLRREREEIRAILAARRYDAARVAQTVKFDREGNPDLEVTVNFSSGRNMMSQLWRTPVHSYAGVAMLSATLSDRPPSDRSYRKFLRAIGIDPMIDSIIEEKPLPASRREAYGAIAHVLVVDRDISLYPIDPNQPNYNSANFVKFVAKALFELVKLQAPEQRMLVLFQQYALLETIWALVPELHPLIIKRQRENNMIGALETYANQRGGIWFGVEWEGMNFVSETGRTLADIVVIPRIPQPPIDLIRQSRLTYVFDGNEQRAEGLALNEAVDYAYQRMVQGIARGIRHSHDVIQLLAILDVRFPVPAHVADTRLIARSIGDVGKLFYGFDHMLDPFNVRQWSQMDKNGGITTILDERDSC